MPRQMEARRARRVVAVVGVVALVLFAFAGCKKVEQAPEPSAELSGPVRKAILAQPYPEDADVVFLAGYATAPAGGEALTAAVAVTEIAPPEAVSATPETMAATPEALPASPAEMAAAPPEAGAYSPAGAEMPPGESLGIAGGPATGAVPPSGLDLTIAYSYNPAGKVDPFAPLVPDAQPDTSATGMAGPKGSGKVRPTGPPRLKTPTEKFDISQFRLTAVIRRPDLGTAIGMVEDPSGKGYKVEKGTYIGKDGGQITEILSDRLVVEEEKEDLMGNLTTRTQELKIEKAAGDQL
ncbi:MAG: pilus assembly protein PilP [Thermodesulfobacteriota bacterium]